MDKPYRLRPGFFLPIVASLSALPAIAQNDHQWNALSSKTFSQCLSRSTCCGGPGCQLEELMIGEDCHKFCESGYCRQGSSGYVAEPNLFEVSGLTVLLTGNCPPKGFCVTDANIRGRVLPPGRFKLDIFQNASPEGGFSPRLQLGVFRYAGDPQAFSGLDAESVEDLVTLGLIAPEDILYSASKSGVLDSTIIIDIQGVPESEIVVFGAGSAFAACPAVPALGGWGAAVLALTLAAAIAITRRDCHG